MASVIPDHESLERSTRTAGGIMEGRGPQIEDVVLPIEARRPPQAGPARFGCRVAYFDDGARVTATGELTYATMPVVRRVVLAAAVLPISAVTLDLAGVDRVDRPAVDALVLMKEEVHERSAIFTIASAPTAVRRALAAEGVEQHFEYESVWSQYPSTTECA
jgi:anti-anti-sigma regulatory factor